MIITDSQPLHAERLLRICEVIELLSIGKSTFYSWVKQGIAPQPIRLSSRCVAWRLSDIIKFIELRKVK
ncbi:helix-turn-helix transcriptional regulator [Budvicia aquatica]|uniref:AlpA family phage regulatory protein n=1 Tax=Budvicia aquatica TaxID=82979 RepID=A0A2C6DEY5_9GAMM|nr:AlpA family phage regulatory protein [Budvicia aquatica]PHI29756.1 AlpA family phage regulatory protein [Budvicia aquatica]